MKNVWKTMAVVVPVAFLAACTDAAKAPAEAAMAAAGAAMDSLKGDAAKYAPAEVKKLESNYDVGKASMANKDYQGALTFTKDIPAKAKEVLAKADAAKAELAKAWKEAGRQHGQDDRGREAPGSRVQRSLRPGWTRRPSRKHMQISRRSRPDGPPLRSSTSPATGAAPSPRRRT